MQSEMLMVHWKGKAVNKNRRYLITRGKRPKLVKTQAYKAWLDSIGWTIKKQTLKHYKTLDTVMISSVLDPAADHHNLIDVVLDALEACGLVLNDRNIGSVISMPCTRHKRGDMDEIWVSIQLGEEA